MALKVKNIGLSLVINSDGSIKGGYIQVKYESSVDKNISAAKRGLKATDLAKIKPNVTWGQILNNLKDKVKDEIGAQ